MCFPQEWEEKKQANIDLVEAEIQAMREAYEAEVNYHVACVVHSYFGTLINEITIHRVSFSMI